MTAQLILASASPRRRDLLDQIKVRYTVYPVAVDETPHSGEMPLDYVRRLAGEKSSACISQLTPRLPVLAADTVVVLGTKIFGKPQDQADALSMLSQLSGQTHQVYSAVSLRSQDQAHEQAVSITEVTFKSLTKQELLSYWQSGEPVDKAGGYAIQGLGSVFVQSINGSFSGVVGLPLFETTQLLAKQGIIILQ